ncbi:unnamed protein product [Linum tenue]|uniref:Uncharacterized protein n=1 Tax=Linum tenue TaxID=586396 RepID=A0AAV0IBD3_9ROSI|nr:unnamed protein product [Linum tenue]
MKVTVKSTTMVQPAEHRPRHSLWLSNLDLLQLRSHVTRAICAYNKHPASSYSESFFFFDVGEAESEAALSEIGELLYTAGGREFSPGKEADDESSRVDYSRGVSSYPLLILQITRLKCDGVCLGIGIHHVVADGESLLSFINTWADMARGLPVTATPFWDHTILRAR